MSWLCKLAAPLAVVVGVVAILGGGVGPMSLIGYYQPELPPELREE